MIRISVRQGGQGFSEEQAVEGGWEMQRDQANGELRRGTCSPGTGKDGGHELRRDSTVEAHGR